MTCRSLLPALSCSRICRRRSSARSALESASVWFWHTRQRSSSASAITRFSRTGSSDIGGASFPTAKAALSAKARKRRTLLTLELAHERNDLLLEDLRRHRADALVADHAALVDHIGLGHAVDPVVDADLAVGVEEGSAIGIAVAHKPAHALDALVLVVEPIERRAADLGIAHQRLVLFAAGDAPGGPHVEEPDLAELLLRGERLVRLLQERQLECRRRLADEGRGHLARIQVQPRGEHQHQRAEDAEHPEDALVHANASATLFGIFFRETR